MVYGSQSHRLKTWLSHTNPKQKKINVLKAQLKFRKEVLHQVAEDKATYNITKTVRDKKSRQNLSVDELKENFKQLN